jgi:hypothetical protein
MDAKSAWNLFRNTGNIEAYLIYKRLTSLESAEEISPILDLGKDTDADKHGRDSNQGNEHR